MALFTDELGLISGSVVIYKDFSDFASSSRLTISPDFSNTGKYDFIYETTGSTPIKLLTLSSSGTDPRIGIGNENPQTTLDIKDVSDTTVGAEILVRSSRTTKGGDPGDAAGKILFVIDSSSYVDVKTSGSVAIITTEVTAINDKMAGGDLIFKVSDKGLNDPDPFEIMRLSRDTSDIINDQVIISGYVTASGNITSNNIIKGNSLTSTTSATIGTFVYADNIRIGTNTAPTSKGLYVSGNITSSNDLSIRGFPSVSSSLASLASGVGTLQQVTNAGNTTTNPISSSFAGVGFFGTASWAINVVNGGGGGGGGSDSAFLTQSTAATTWSFAHNLGTQYPVITVYDTNGQVIIPQEIDGEDTNNLKIYFPTSQSGYATAVGGTSALTYYSQSLTTASVNLNTITFTKGDSSTFPIVVNTFPYTGSAIISGSLIVTGSTAITGGFEALGTKGSKIQLGTYNVGYDIGGIDTFFITGAGLIISGNMPDQNHHNFLKIGNVEIVDVNTAFTSNEFLIHNVNTLRITSGADGGNITTGNQLLKIGGGDFYVYRAGSSNSAGIIRSTGVITTIQDTNVALEATNLSLTPTNLNISIPDTNEISTLNGTDYLIGFGTNPTPSAQLTQKIKANKFIWVTGSNQIISGGLIITGSLNATSFTGSLFGTASWAQSASNAINSQTASFLPIGTYNITASWAQSASNAVNARTASFINNLNQNLSITGAVVLSGSSLPELRVIGETQFTGSVSSLNGFTGSLFGTASWATNALTASFASTASNISPAISNDSDTRITTANGNGTLNAESLLTFDGTKLSILYQSGEEGGEILLNKPVTNTSLTGSGITIDSYQNKIRFFEQGGAARGAYIDLTACAGGVGTNLLTGGGGATINNNVDNYIITATGTANTLNGEVGLQYSGSILINASRSQFGGAAVADTTHQFRGLSSDTYAGFLIQDPDGEDIFKTEGSIANSTLGVSIGDFNNVSNGTAITIDVTNDDILLRGKLVADNTKGITGSLFGTASWATNALTASNLTPAITNNTDNRVLTATGAGSINGEANLTFDGSLLDIIGDIQFNENRIRTSSTTVGQPGKGADLAYDWGNFTTAPTAGRIVYFASGSGGFGWRDALASATGSSIGPLGVATNAASQDEIMLRGTVRVSGSLSGLVAGQVVYLSNTVSGSITGTAPSTSGHVVRILGYVISPTDNTMYFNPDFSYITRT